MSSSFIMEISSSKAVSFDDQPSRRLNRDGASILTGGVFTTGEGSDVAHSMDSSTALSSSLEALAKQEQNDKSISSKLGQLVGTLNKSYNERRREKILHLKALRTTSSREGVAKKDVEEHQRLVRPYGIFPDRHKSLVADVLERAKAKNEVNELTLYVPAEGKFLGIIVDADTGKHRLVLLEGDRFLHADCATWRLFPADRAAREPVFLLQNVFSTLYLGVCPLGHAVCRTGRPSTQEHLRLVPDRASGLLILFIPHWHWGRGAPLCVRGVGKGNTPLWPGETRWLEQLAKQGFHSENPARSLRCGFGGPSDAYDVPGGSTQPCHFQVTWRPQPVEHSAVHLAARASSARSNASGDDADVSWLGLSRNDYRTSRLERAGRG